MHYYFFGVLSSFFYIAKNIKFLKLVKKLQKKFRFNLNFEGGEAETFVTNCPLFEKRLLIQDSITEWDGYRGRFEILEAKLKDNA